MSLSLRSVLTLSNTSLVASSSAPAVLQLRFVAGKNLGALLESLGEGEAALSALWGAAQLDGEDVVLWHRLGTLEVPAGSIGT